jgi:predicted O-methyltransferase YrrM
MDITNKLIEMAAGELVKDKEVSDASGKWSMFNDGGIMVEDGELLYAFIRETKAESVLETGTHRGIGAAYMGSALKENGKGMLATIEFLQPHFDYSKELMSKLGLSDWVTHIKADVADFLKNAQDAPQHPSYRYDLVLLDTEPQTRFQELIDVFPLVNPGGYIFIHDLHPHMHQIGINPDHPNEPNWPYGTLPDTIRKWVKQGKLRPFHFRTPRGLTAFYKTHPEDFAW